MGETMGGVPRDAREIARSRLAQRQEAAKQSEATAAQESADETASITAAENLLEHSDTADKVATALSSIRSIDAKLEAVNQSLSNLDASNESALGAVGNSKLSYGNLVAAKAEIATLIQDPELHLSKGGIQSNEDFLADEVYGGSRQAVAFNQASTALSEAHATKRRSVGEMRHAKAAARALIEAEKVESKPEGILKHEQIVADLKSVEAALQARRAELVQEVPWMKEAEMQERMSKILPGVREHSKSVNGFNPSYKLTEKQAINRTPTLVDEFALKAAKVLGENGEALVKGEIKSVFGEIIDTQRGQNDIVARNAAEMQGVATLESLAGHWQRVGKQLESLQFTKKVTEQKMEALIGSNSEALDAAKRRYPEFGPNMTARKAARAYLRSISYDHTFYLGVGRETDDSVENIYSSKVIQTQLDAAREITSWNRTERVPRAFKLLDAQQAENALHAQSAFYEKLQAALVSSPQLLGESLRTGPNQTDPLFDAAKATEEEVLGVKIDTYRKDAPKTLDIPDEVSSRLIAKGQPLHSLKSDLVREKKGLDEATAALKQQIEAKIDMNYLQATVIEMSNDPEKLAQKFEAKRLSKAARAGEHMLGLLIAIRVPVDLQETKINVGLNGNRISADFRSDFTFTALLQRYQALEQELGAIETELAAKRNALRNKTFFKGKLKAEVAALTQSRTAKNAEVTKAEAASTKRSNEVTENFSQFVTVINSYAQNTPLDNLDPLNGKSYKEFSAAVASQLLSLPERNVEASNWDLVVQERKLESAELEYNRLYGENRG